jgi:hypothetical protein
MLEMHPLRGALVESWVAGELLKAQAVRGLRARIFHWRDQNAAEADLVVDLNGKLTVIEVKSARTVQQDWARALERMTNALPAGTPVERVIVHGGGDDMPPLPGTTLVPWSRVAEFARGVFGGKPDAAAPKSPAKRVVVKKARKTQKKSAPPKSTGRGVVRKTAKKAGRARR